ncbi:sugar dehydrogenase complex small subunit [Paraburkholderia sp.]|uniref:sugar dehydrogenase complex small subunit n=1 Tax=Paraburkholderia sp. TaxID=1926495 RepID=UPI00239BB1B1|nr:sugar dehydrogenase complex small subunit [Paraburkholderia sp.]MDE1181889.1 sugar dehydrogenase complex small subunit [Paraburkholderia sp.]
MTPSPEPDQGHRAPDPGRRLVLSAILASYASSFIPWSSANAQTGAAAPAVAPDAFVQVSRLITGRATLDASQANRLYAALVTAVPGFSEQLSALAAFVASNGSTAQQLQASLDAAKAPFAKLPGVIAIAWYVGVAGSGVAAHCVTYETSLMNVVVADRLKPPSYAYGPYGSWGRNPLVAMTSATPVAATTSAAQAPSTTSRTQHV